METLAQTRIPALPPLEAALDEHGFLVNPASWTPRLAEALAARLGLEALGPAEWEVIWVLRKDYLRRGAAPAMRTVCRRTGASRQSIRALFGGCANLLKIAGLPEPGEEARAYLS